MSNQSLFGWTAQARSAFLASLAACGTVRGAAQSVNLSPQAAYKLRARDPAFARAWDAALGIARDHLVAHLTTVAFEGWTEEVWYKGELVGERHRHNPMVAMRLLERLDRMAEQQAQPIERFDTMLRAESNGHPVRDPAVRSEAELHEQIEAAEDDVRLYRARDLRRHLDVVHATATPWLCDYDDCDACRDAEEALRFDPTAEIATEVDGAVIGCLHHDDLPDRDVRAGSVFDSRCAEIDEADGDDACHVSDGVRDMIANPWPDVPCEPISPKRLEYPPAEPSHVHQTADHADCIGPWSPDQAGGGKGDWDGDWEGARDNDDNEFTHPVVPDLIGDPWSAPPTEPPPAAIAATLHPVPTATTRAQPEPAEGTAPTATNRAQSELVEGQAPTTTNRAQPERVGGPGPATPNPAPARQIPALECQPVSTTTRQANEKAAPPCGDAAHSVQPDGVAD